jgi:predicted amidohydrolase
VKIAVPAVGTFPADPTTISCRHLTVVTGFSGCPTRYFFDPADEYNCQRQPMGMLRYLRHNQTGRAHLALQNSPMDETLSNDDNILTIGLAQIAPVWMDRAATVAKVESYVDHAARQQCRLVVFGEALVPGYPFWLELTGGARFNSPVQKEIFAEYAAQAVQLEAGHLDRLCAAADRNGIAIYLGCVERAADRGGHSLYCSLVFIDQRGEIGSVHRKLMPTYEERLVWSAGDGHGLRTHKVGAFQVGGLNCWENWMPLARSSLYAQGENLHVAVWPGGIHNTRNITRFIAMESCRTEPLRSPTSTSSWISSACQPRNSWRSRASSCTAWKRVARSVSSLRSQYRSS